MAHASGLNPAPSADRQMPFDASRDLPSRYSEAIQASHEREFNGFEQVYVLAWPMAIRHEVLEIKAIEQRSM